MGGEEAPFGLFVERPEGMEGRQRGEQPPLVEQVAKPPGLAGLAPPFAGVLPVGFRTEASDENSVFHPLAGGEVLF